jgi:hypothetical protein
MNSGEDSTELSATQAAAAGDSDQTVLAMTPPTKAALELAWSHDEATTAVARGELLLNAPASSSSPPRQSLSLSVFRPGLCSTSMTRPDRYMPRTLRAQSPPRRRRPPHHHRRPR